jgi:cytochrome b561
MEPLTKIPPRMNGIQKLGVARCFIVIPLLLLSFTLSGTLLSLLAPVVLPWCLYIAYNHGRSSHQLQAVNGFQQAVANPVYRGMTAKHWYIAAAIAGIVMVVGVMALYPDDISAGATGALYFATFRSFFFCGFLTRVGLRMGWSSVTECEPGTDAAQVVRLVNPDAVKRQQLIYTLAGLIVLFGALSSLATSFPLWANGSASSSALTPEEQGLSNALGN